MTPSKPFLISLAAVGATTLLAAALPRTTAAEAAGRGSTAPMSTRLTSAMTDYFGLDFALETRPAIAALVACHALPACGSSDSSRVRFIDASGADVAVHDGKPTSMIEHIRQTHATREGGVTDSRTLVRRYQTDVQGRLVMNGSDSIVTVDPGDSRRVPSTLVRVHRYADVRYLVNDSTFHWPITGLVVLELSHTVGDRQRAPVRVLPHAAVSFDGTRYAQVLTTGALSHRVNLQSRQLETTMPKR